MRARRGEVQVLIERREFCDVYEALPPETLWQRLSVWLSYWWWRLR